MTDPTQTAKCIAEVAKNLRGTKPILASWMGGAGVVQGRAILDEAGIPTYDYPDSAAEMFSYMFQYSVNISQVRFSFSILYYTTFVFTDLIWIKCSFVFFV